MSEGKVCKYCGTTNEEDFIRKSGKIGKTVCTKCLSKNLSIANSGENNPLFGKPRSQVTCKKISESTKGIPKSDEAKQNMAVAAKQKSCREHSDSTKLKMSLSAKGKPNLSIKYKLKDYQEKYPWFFLFEEMRDLPESELEVGKAGVQVRCKKCNVWMNSTYQNIANRINSLKDNKHANYFYCSDECKNSCSLFGLNINYFMNDLNRDDKKYIDGLNTWRSEVLNRQLKEEDICFNHCEICNSEVDLQVHHEKPQKTHPHLALDPDNGIILCGTCHYKFGHINDCSTGSLANKVCTQIFNVGGVG